MNRELFTILGNISSYSILLPIGVGLVTWFFRDGLREIQWRIGALVLVSGLFEMLARPFSLPFWEWLFGEPRNLPGAHFFTMAQFVLVVWIYRELVNQVAARLSLLLITGFLILGVTNGLYIDEFRNLNPTTRAVEAIILLVIIIGYFYNLLRQKVLVSLEREPLFWTSAGLLIYLSGSLFIFLVSNVFLSSQETTEILYSIYYGIHSLLNILLNLTLAVALWIRSPQRLSRPAI